MTIILVISRVIQKLNSSIPVSNQKWQSRKCSIWNIPTKNVIPVQRKSKKSCISYEGLLFFNLLLLSQINYVMLVFGEWMLQKFYILFYTRFWKRFFYKKRSTGGEFIGSIVNFHCQLIVDSCPIQDSRKCFYFKNGPHSHYIHLLTLIGMLYPITFWTQETVFYQQR